MQQWRRQELRQRQVHMHRYARGKHMRHPWKSWAWWLMLMPMLMVNPTALRMCARNTLATPTHSPHLATLSVLSISTSPSSRGTRPCTSAPRWPPSQHPSSPNSDCMSS